MKQLINEYQDKFGFLANKWIILMAFIYRIYVKMFQVEQFYEKVEDVNETWVSDRRSFFKCVKHEFGIMRSISLTYLFVKALFGN